MQVFSQAALETIVEPHEEKGMLFCSSLFSHPQKSAFVVMNSHIFLAGIPVFLNTHK